MEQTSMVYTAQGDINYIDLTKALTVLNGKHYTQFKNDKPLVYTVRARLTTPGDQVDTAPTSWAVRNGLVKTAAAWRKMLKKAGVSKKDLNTYGKELRIGLDGLHNGIWGTKFVDGSGVTLRSELLPDQVLDANGRCEYDTGLKSAQGDPIYSTAFTPTAAEYGVATSNVYREHAFDKTVATVPNPSGNVTGELSWDPYILGSGSIVRTYINSRDSNVDTHDDDFDQVIANPDNYLTLMLSDNEESADDVIENVQNEGDFRPYSLEYQNTYATAILAGANVAGQDSTFAAPCGLLRWTSRVGQKMIVTVTAHMPM